MNGERDSAFATLSALCMLLQPLSALAQASQSPQGWDWPGPWHMMWGGGWGFWWVFPLFMLLMFVVCVFLMMRGPWGHGRHSERDATSSASRTLNERLAKGEIQLTEYEEKKTAILRRT